ncbi:MAG: hypothetical protein LBF04_02545 [Prevotellaceae bacterium]|jgi:hypothetical protein|nr:hypothetical protein [Prevotellaceae bacterium]
MFRKNQIIIAIICSFAFSTATMAQKAFDQLAVGLETGTYGPGITASTSLFPNFKLRGGFDFFSFSPNLDFDISPDGYIPNGTDQAEKLSGSLYDPKLSFVNFKLLLDCYPWKNGIFSISAGFYLGANSISMKGRINDYDPDMVFELNDDIVVKPRTDGTFDAKVKLGSFIKPYFGIGLGRSIANKRVAFKFDLGIIYQGDFKFDSDQVSGLQKVQDRLNNNDELKDLPKGILKLWPMLNFSLTYKIF